MQLQPLDRDHITAITAALIALRLLEGELLMLMDVINDHPEAQEAQEVRETPVRTKAVSPRSLRGTNRLRSKEAERKARWRADPANRARYNESQRLLMRARRAVERQERRQAPAGT